MLARFCTAPRRGGHHHLMTASFEQAMLLTPLQMDSLLRDVVTKHLRKLKRLSSAAKLYPNLTLRVPNPTIGAAWMYQFSMRKNPAPSFARPTKQICLRTVCPPRILRLPRIIWRYCATIDWCRPDMASCKICLPQWRACQREPFGLGAGRLFSWNVDGACAV